MDVDDIGISDEGLDPDDYCENGDHHQDEPLGGEDDFCVADDSASSSIPPPVDDEKVTEWVQLCSQTSASLSNGVALDTLDTECAGIVDIWGRLSTQYNKSRYRMVHFFNMLFHGTDTKDRYIQLMDHLKTIQRHAHIAEKVDFVQSINVIGSSVNSGFQACMCLTLSMDTCNNTTLGVKNGSQMYGPLEMLCDEVPETEITQGQRLLKFVMQQVGTQGVVRYKDMLYRPKYITNRQHTYFYEPYKSYKGFLWEQFQGWDDHSWCIHIITKYPSAERMIVNYLENSTQIQNIVPCRYMFSFLNGIYNAKTNMLYAYQRGDTPWVGDIPTPERTTCNFLDYEFEFRTYESEMKGTGNPSLIQTPNMQRILDAQQIPEDAALWLYGLTGRLLFDVGDMDNWQVFPFIKGTAGSGKSTWFDVFTRVYQHSDVGVMISQGRRDFCIEHLYDKYTFLCADVDNKLTVPDTTWTLIATGERVAVDRKHKSAIDTNWTTTCAMSGNEYPPFTDNGGRMGRRLVQWLFDSVVAQGDTQLKDKCLSNLPKILYKCVTAYHYLLARHKHKVLYSSTEVLPKYFHVTKLEMQKRTNSLTGFVHSNNVKPEPHSTVPLDTFIKAYSDYVQNNRMKMVNVDIANMNAILYNSGFFIEGLDIGNGRTSTVINNMRLT